MPANNSDQRVAIAHTIEEHETISDAAQTIWEQIQTGTEARKEAERVLVLTINGHRAEEGEFTREMWHFLTEFVIPIATAFTDSFQINGKMFDSGDSGVDSLKEPVDENVSVEASEELTSEAKEAELILGNTLHFEYNGDKMGWALIDSEEYNSANPPSLL